MLPETSNTPPHRLIRVVRLWTLLLVFLLLLGCGQAGPSQDMTNLMHLVDLRRHYVEVHNGREPKSADELREWLNANGKQELEIRGITDVDALFTSSRDGAPFVIVPESQGAMTSDQNRIVAYESKGQGEKRLVAFDLGQVLEMEEELLVHLQEEHVPAR